MLEYRNVSLSCGGIKLLEDINICFEKGKLTTVIGPNGCGKTTLVQALNGVSRVTSGKLILDGTDITALSSKERARRLSFLPQVRGVIPALEVKTLVSHGRFPYLGFSRKMSAEDRDIVIRAMERAAVSGYADKQADTLSGGVRQRAFVALQLAQDCGYVVADEPTTYLDIPSQRQILKVYSGLRDEGRTVILVLHDISAALEISDRIVIMNDRKIAGAGTPSELIRSGLIEEIFDVKIKKLSDDDGESFVVR